MMLIACLVLVALITCMAAAFARPVWYWPVGCIFLSVLWLFVNNPVEGPTLWVISAGHGLTVSDLLAPPCLVLGVWLLRRAVHARLTSSSS